MLTVAVAIATATVSAQGAPRGKGSVVAPSPKTASSKAASPKAAKPKAHTVTIRGFQYTPATLRVQAGDTVTWTNADIVPHTATAQGKHGFDSANLNADASWRHVPTRRGTYEYVCTFHPTMRATLVVR